MRNPMRRRLNVELPRDELERFKFICRAHNVYPGSVLRCFAEMVAGGKLGVPHDVRKIPRSGKGSPR